jgi:hypothetical protein
VIHRILIPAKPCNLLLTLLVLSATLSVAQTDIKIMVSGPFAYVSDPINAGRLVIVAPDDPDHGPPAIYAGDDAQHPTGKPTIPMGMYKIDIDNLQSCGTSLTGTPSSSTFLVKGVDVNNTIKPMLQGPSSRYAFSLPQPCSYVSNTEAYQKIWDSGSGSEKSYTILMELHYKVSSVAKAHLRGTSDGHHMYITDFNLSSLRTAAALSVVMTAPPYDSDFECDSVSAESVVEEADLFKHGLSIRMPTLDFAGHQRHGVYSLNCTDPQIIRQRLHNASHALIKTKQLNEYFSDPVPDELQAALNMLADLNRELQYLPQLPPPIKQELEDAPKVLRKRVEDFKSQKFSDNQAPGVEMSALSLLPKTSLFLLPLTPGAGDCRGAQLDVNSALP